MQLNAVLSRRTRTKLEHVLAAFIRPALALTLDEAGGSAFVRVLARAYAEHERTPAQVPVRQLRPCAARIRRRFRASACPHLDKEELYWRLDFITGALTYAMADFGLIKRRGRRLGESASRRAPPST